MTCGAATPPGRRLPPRPARAADRRPRGLLRRVRRRRRPRPGVPPPARARRDVLDPAAAASAPAGRSRRSASWSSPPTTTRSATARSATGCRPRPPLAALCTLLSPFTPMIFQGDEYGEQAPFQFFTDHIDEDIATATREGRRREFEAFAEFRGREVPDPQDLRRSRRPSSRARANPACCDAPARPPRPPARRRRRDRPRRARRLAARAARAVRAAANFSRRATHVPLDGSAEVVVAAGHATLEPGYVLLAPSPVPWSG